MNTKEISHVAAARGALEGLLTGARELSFGNEQAALDAFTHALDGDAVIGALCSARLHILRREPDRAARTLKALIEREPGLAEAHYLLGTVQRGRCRTIEAVGCFREAVRLDPGHSRAASELSELLDVQDP